MVEMLVVVVEVEVEEEEERSRRIRHFADSGTDSYNVNCLHHQRQLHICVYYSYVAQINLPDCALSSEQKIVKLKVTWK